MKVCILQAGLFREHYACSKIPTVCRKHAENHGVRAVAVRTVCAHQCAQPHDGSTHHGIRVCMEAHEAHMQHQPQGWFCVTAVEMK